MITEVQNDEIAIILAKIYSLILEIELGSNQSNRIKVSEQDREGESADARNDHTG